MAPDRYRSYVIRVRRRGSTGTGAMRLDVEDLLQGGRATVSGDPARSLADSLERLIGPRNADAPERAPARASDLSAPAEGQST